MLLFANKKIFKTKWNVSAKDTTGEQIDMALGSVETRG